MARRRVQFEEALRQLDAGLSRPRTRKRLDLVWERIDRIKTGSGGIWQHYTLEVVADEARGRVVQVKWKLMPQAPSMLTHPGVYSLRNNIKDWGTERLWCTYVLLTDLEAVFRSLKSELGRRPIYH